MEEGRRYGQWYRMVLAILPVLGVGMICNTEQAWGYSELWLMIEIVVMLGVIHGLYMVRRQPLLYVIVSVVVVIGSLVALSRLEEIQKREVANERVVQVLLLLGMGVLSYIAASVYVVRQVVAILLALVAFIVGTREEMLSKIGMVSLVMYCIMVLGELALHNKLKGEKERCKMATQSLLPVYMIAYVVLLALPIGEQPMQWKMIRATVSKISQSVASFGKMLKKEREDEGDFQIPMTGYSEKAGIGGTVIESDEVAVKLISPLAKRQTVYLMGNYKDRYEKNEWKETVQESEYQLERSEATLDTMEMLYALYRYNGLSDVESYIRKGELGILYEGLRTKSIFRTGKAIGISYGELAVPRASSLLGPRFEKIAVEGTTYQVQYYEINRYGKQFSDWIKKEEGKTYETEDKKELLSMREAVRKNSRLEYIAIPTDLNAQLQKRRTFLYDHFTKVDKSLLQKLQPLATTITGKAVGAYEKMQAIESYLNTYRYTLTPEKPKEEEDVILTFLFSSKEGYCTQFATAMALLGRCTGIPTRYVQGYVVSAEKDGWTEYEVKEKQAHAWVEAYIDGIGWMPFEPTPGYESVQYWEQGEQEIENRKTPIPATAQERERKMGLESEEEKSSSSTIAEKIGMGMVAVVTLLAVACFVVLMRILQTKRKYDRLGLTKKFYCEVVRMQWLLQHLSYCRKDSETWNEYMGRVEGEMGEELPRLSSIRDAYTTMRYHQENVGEESYSYICEANAILLRKIKQKKRFSAYVRIYLQDKMQSAVQG